MWKPEFGAWLCQTTTEVCLATHQSWAIQPKDRGARSSAQHQVASKQMCVISQLTCVCPWWHIYSVMVELPICIWGDRSLIYRLKKIFRKQSCRQNSRSKKPLFSDSTQSHLLPWNPPSPYRCQQLKLYSILKYCASQKAGNVWETKEGADERAGEHRETPATSS